MAETFDILAEPIRGHILGLPRQRGHILGLPRQRGLGPGEPVRRPDRPADPGVCEHLLVLRQVRLLPAQDRV